MTDELHTLGFKVILWIAPFVSDQAADFQNLKDENLLVLDKNGKPAKRNGGTAPTICWISPTRRRRTGSLPAPNI